MHLFENKFTYLDFRHHFNFCYLEILFHSFWYHFIGSSLAFCSIYKGFINGFLRLPSAEVSARLDRAYCPRGTICLGTAGIHLVLEWTSIHRFWEITYLEWTQLRGKVGVNCVFWWSTCHHNNYDQTYVQCWNHFFQSCYFELSTPCMLSYRSRQKKKGTT